MDGTTSRKQARARVLERQRDAAAAREARERANIGDLTEFTVQAARAAEVDGWLAHRLEALHAEAERRRDTHRLAAGLALRRMRLRGETIPGIADAAGVSIGRVRDFLKMAARSDAGDQPAAAVASAQVPPLPTPMDQIADGRAVSARDAADRQGT
ncbi:hypothetical protein [Mycolicibacterium arenosum]|uniref:Uncharacterized protein n=1 Tax=Mycolicibacterium arenosum TaxID=2952157 RepID=A0ABT1LWF8_9MYCO|nr:hypothetical protein [Mycolicibacterium sp. CAU 1645]MCP9271239.1 hypothetical protein [Mycolicibacterium sp. CAU 1645]